jgi:glutaredoxin
MMLELYGTQSCQYTADLREDLLFDGRDFTEYDVEADAEALARMRTLTNGGTTVPVLVEDGEVIQVGWQGRGCFVGGTS